CRGGQAVFTLPDGPVLPGAEPGPGAGRRRVVVEVQGTGDAETSPGGPPLLQGYRTDAPGLELVADVEAARVFRVPGAAPRYLSPAATAPTTGDGLTAVTDPGFEPLARSIVDGPGPEPSAQGTAPGDVEVLDESSGHVRLRVRRDAPGWLVAQHAYYPGWRATVDGDAAPVRRVNGAFLGVPVPEGESIVELRYRPASVTAGGLLSLAGVVVLVGLLVGPRRAWAGAEALGHSTRRARRASTEAGN
ncbi:MAG TPA: YfhO family protein, partial [Acidimicrobiales bacterium]|nr:YfhO family protein [Acidimicrobiales bacterium]